MERDFIMKKEKFLATTLSILMAFASHLTPVVAMKTAVSPVDSKLSSESDTATANHIAFLREFKDLAESCDYDPYFDYETEEARLMGRARLDTIQASMMQKEYVDDYLKQSHKASLQIVKDHYHGICRHFCVCVVELCKKYGIEFRIATIRRSGHSAVIYKFGEHGYVADMLLQVARNKNFNAKDSNGRAASEIAKDRATLAGIALGIMQDIKKAKAFGDPGVLADPVIKDYLGDDTKGMEFGRIPVQTYLHNAALPGDTNYYCDENFRPTACFFS